MIGIKSIARAIARTRSLHRIVVSKNLPNESVSLLNVAKRRPEEDGCYTGDVFNDLFGPTELRNDLLSALSGKIRMRPCVDCDLMTRHVLGLESRRIRDGTAADNEKGGVNVFLVQILQKIRGVRGWTIIEGGAPGELVGTGNDVCRSTAVATGPPASPRGGGIGCGAWVGWTATEDGRGYSGWGCWNS